MKFPKRVPQHISESKSYKVFTSKIPHNWIVRDVTERDYGIDCYLEMVTDENELKGELALIQLKSRKSIKWNDNDRYTISGINISTSNYWFKFSIPVFIFLCDLENEKVFFESVHYFIRRNFDTFTEQKSLNYKIRKEFEFEGKDGVFKFKFKFYYEHLRSQFENELLFFMSNLFHFKEFQDQHSNRDFHLGLEIEDMVFFESMVKNYRFLSMYLNIDNIIPQLSQIKNRSKEKFGIDSYYELYEHDVAELVPTLEKLTIKILTELKIFLNGEITYWERINPTVSNYLTMIDDNGELIY